MTTQIKQRIEQIQRGEVPEGYKKTKAGIMPLDWCAEKEYKAKDVFKSVTNKKHNGEFEILSATQDKGVVPRSQIDIDIKYSEESVSGYKKVDQGDFVISLRSFQGGIEYSEYEGLVSPAYTILKPIVPIYDGYYKAYLKTVDYISRLNKGTYGIRDGKQIGFEDFGDMILHYPPLSEQQKIAEILSAQDKLIALKEKLIEEKKRQKKALMQQLLTGKKRLPGCSGEWGKSKIKEVSMEVITGSTPSKKDSALWDGEFPWITSQDFNGKYINKSFVTLSSLGKEECRIVPAKSVLVTCIASIGLNAITNIECATNQQINAVVCASDQMAEYIYYYVEFQSEKMKRLAGKTAVPIISKSQFENIFIIYPNDKIELQKIVEVLSVCDTEIELIQKDLDQEKQKKKALMQLLLTGIVRTAKEDT